MTPEKQNCNKAIHVHILFFVSQIKRGHQIDVKKQARKQIDIVSIQKNMKVSHSLKKYKIEFK